MNKMFKNTLTFIFVLMPIFIYSANWFVNDNSTFGDFYCTAIGNDLNSGTIAGAPKLTLQAALTLAAAGDVIYVDRGTFTDTGNRALDFNKSIKIIGAGTSNTIFTSHTNHRFATISANNVILQNIQLFDFFLDAANGQVIFVNPNVTGFKLYNIAIKKNIGNSIASESIYLSEGSSSEFDGLSFSCSGSNGGSGGATKVNDATLIVKNCSFYNSRDNDGAGGAIEMIGADPNVTIDNSIFEANIARRGGAISQSAGDLVVTDSCFFRNYIAADGSATENGGGHYYSSGTDASLTASFTNSCFIGAFFCATTNPVGFACQFSTNVSNDGNSISLRGTQGTFSFNTCLFDNSSQPNANFDNGLDFYLDKSGPISVTITNCKFANDMYGGAGSGGSDAINIWNEDLTPTEFIVTNSGVKQTTANQDNITGNNYSYAGVAPGGNNSLALSSTKTPCISGNFTICSALVENTCKLNPVTGTNINNSAVGISTMSQINNENWPTNIPNAQLVIESTNKGFVITRLTSTERDNLNAVEGMFIYNITINCFQLYNGTFWHCMERTCAN